MNQDSAVIVSWLKAPGDAVAEGEPIFEVETDKATMEVEAQAAGFLGQIIAAAGADVPVGGVIARIVETQAEAADQGDVPATANEAPLPQPAAEPAPPPPTPPNTAPAPSTDRVLASPKAKRLAKERGIDLQALRSQGVAEPIHSADIAQQVAGAVSVLTARADGSALDALLAKSDDPETRTLLLAQFAQRAWLQATGTEAGISIRHLDGAITPVENPALTLVDLCDTRLSTYSPSSGNTLSVGAEGGVYQLTLSFREAQLPFAQAVELLGEIAARIDDPIRQLL